MIKINDILTIDLQEDIKNVIDLEDRTELEIQHEIESYIVTEGIGRHLYDFTNQFSSNIKETGVWLSGFYGSGKSYFGKMLGYVIGNPMINGTPARERFIPRIKGVADESLIENSIRNLEQINSRVVFLDVAKQNTDKGLAFTLFANLLKSLGFRDDLYGYMEFELFIDGKLDDFKSKAKELEGKDWDELKTSNRHVAKVMRKVFFKMGYSEADYEDTKKVYESAIENFSSSKFKSEIEKYLKLKTDETIVFIFDEASEAISQRKFNLLDLEGISESLSSISNKVWTIAIAQEKLDDVINNANVNRSQLTKVTDRFKTKIHLESTEVDVIIRSRLLSKTDLGLKQLMEYHKENEGLVKDITNLNTTFPTITKDDVEFATYYPFHKYQFDILQKFLFSSNALVATQIAARGMIITTFDVLRKQMQEKNIFDFTPAYAICSEAQTAPPIGLVNKYDTASKILKSTNSIIDGGKLLKTIHLLADSEVVFPTVENITKSYISDIKSYYNVKPDIEESLLLLLDAKVLLVSNNNYKITSDLEGKLLEEMNSFDVELFRKKRELINCIKSYKLYNSVAIFIDGLDSFKFSVLSDQDDELTISGIKQLKLIVYSLFNINEDRLDFIEKLKFETQNKSDQITLVPDNIDFSKIDHLIGEVSRYSYMEEKYCNESDPAKRQIIRDFSLIREEKEKELRVKIEKAYHNATLIYMYDDYLLNSDTFKGTISEVQRKLIKNIYTKRLASGLSEGLVTNIFNCSKDKLSGLFASDDFKFFDKHGNFTGDHLRVVEEISEKLKGYVDGKSLETDLSNAPWGYSFGTIVSTLAALLRSGRLSVKYNGNSYFSHNDKNVYEAFTNATKFRLASFKSITTSLTASQKQEAVEVLMDLDTKLYTDRKVDWSTNDFDLADIVRDLADHFCTGLKTLQDTVDRFDSLFSTVVSQKDILQSFTGKTTENNYIEKVEKLIIDKQDFSRAIKIILKAQKFIKNDLSKVAEFKRFIELVIAELKKADKFDDDIEQASKEFLRLYNDDMVKNFSALQGQVQVVKDRYFFLIKIASEGMTHEYQLLKGRIDTAQKTLNSYPTDINISNKKKLTELKRYCENRIVKKPTLEYSVTCQNSGFSLSDIINYTALAPNKANELLILQSSFVKEVPEPVSVAIDQLDQSNQPVVIKKPRKVQFHIANKVMTVSSYKQLLTSQLSALASAKPDDEIELEID